jgi:hypothetical protein
LFLSLTLADWIKLAIAVGPVILIGLQFLSHQSFIVKSTAWSNIVQGAIRIVAQIEDTLKADPTMSRSQLVTAGISELRTVYADSFAKLGWSTSAGDEVLQLLFQRLAKFLPSAVDPLVTQFLGGGTVPGASSTPLVVKSIRTTWLRPLGLPAPKPGKF